jgi:superfamily II DNA or RNA helicase
MREYIAAYRRGDTKYAALVHMPTGTGKTRVIATLARYAPEVKGALILAPRIALRKQLLEKLEERFFQRGVDKTRRLPKRVLELEKQHLRDTSSRKVPTVFVGTIQKLDRISARDQRSLQFLLAKVSLLIVDEGHYEPALSWSEAIRQFKVPRILFTATPFRNDYKPFDVDDRYAYSYPFEKAVEKRYVRDVEFKQKTPTEDPATFVADVIDFYNKQFVSNGIEARVIIRCDTEDSIGAIAGVLENEKQDYVAIHENFKTSVTTRRYKSVPHPKKTTATFWIHQLKLLEGIDDERFRLVAMFEPFDNARQLIQQVGRVVRNTKRLPNQTAYVLDHHASFHEDMWNRYRNWGRKVKAEMQMVSLGKRVEAMLKEHQPPAEYIDGDFRPRLDLDSVAIWNELQLPRAVNLLRKESDFTLEGFRSFLEDRFLKEDLNYRPFELPPHTVVYMYFAYENSPFLRESYYLQLSHGVMVVREFNNCIAFYDSTDFLPINTPEAGIGKALDSSKLRSLFPEPTASPTNPAASPGEPAASSSPEPAASYKPKNSFLTMVSMRSSLLGGRAVRSRSFWAADVQETIPALDDHAQILKSVFGYAPVNGKNEEDDLNGAGPTEESRTRRYIGFNRGRVSQAGDFCTLAGYLGWLDRIEEVIDQVPAPLEAFKRFAASEDKVRSRKPRNILLDLYEIQDNYVTIVDKLREIEAGQEMDIDDLCQPVNDGKFNLTVRVSDKTFKCPMQVTYDDVKHRYRISSGEANPQDLKTVQLASLFRPRAGLRHESVLAYLNRTQSFRILPQSRNHIYVHGEFYRPVIKIGKDFDADSFQVGKTIFTFAKLHPGRIRKGYEKGQKCQKSGDGWEVGSLFDLIDTLGGDDDALSQELGDPEILVCDDMETEMADFILADSKKNLVAFIHAKASDEPRFYSATAITNVVGQALKNIHYLSMFHHEKPQANIDKWGRKWGANRVEGFVRERIRRPRGADPAKVWARIEAIIRDPLARREVWLFLGQTLSKKSLQDELAQSTDEAVQAAILLHGTMASIASIDAKMRVFCSE